MGASAGMGGAPGGRGEGEGPHDAPPSPPAGGTDEERAATPPPRRPRTVLLGVSVAAALLIGIGAPTVDAILFYRSGQPSDIEHVVAAGKELTFEHVSWKAGVAPMQAPETSTPDKAWLKVTIVRKGVDETGIKLTGIPELEMRDGEDRSWKVEITNHDVATDDAEVNKPYTIEAATVVPKAVADKVELRLRPNTTYRSDTPVDELLIVPTDPAEVEKGKRKDVLVFRR
ncbi:hypothetical protein AB0I81_57080 [Nonomuraea sp. NPDC050404]|uniref:hypothetical protein n=1 Tax=Nonomuraea sp. NPDC050404 TaxID=3155783 RepID=UPI0033ED0BAE